MIRFLWRWLRAAVTPIPAHADTGAGDGLDPWFASLRDPDGLPPVNLIPPPAPAYRRAGVYRRLSHDDTTFIPLPLGDDQAEPHRGWRLVQSLTAPAAAAPVQAPPAAVWRARDRDPLADVDVTESTDAEPLFLALLTEFRGRQLTAGASR